MAGVTFFMGNQMGGRKTGWLAAGALLGMHEFWISGSQARVDMVFAVALRWPSPDSFCTKTLKDENTSNAGLGYSVDESSDLQDSLIEID